jgi:tetratricopeptide (TPR) repeat protein
MRYRQGVEAYDAGKYRVAVDYFLEADHLAPNAALSFNIARAYEKLDDPGATLRWYRDYLRRDHEAPDRAAVEDRIHAMEARLAQKGVQQLTVLSDPEGATVTLDGRAMGVTPWTSEIAPGPHNLVLNLDGHAPEARTVELAADRAQDVVITLSAAAVSALPAASPEESGPPPPAPPSPEVGAPHGSKTGTTMTTIGWVGIGVGGAALGAALVCEILRASAESDAKRQTTQIAYADRLDTMESYQTAARVLTGTGAAIAVAGGVFLWLGMSAKSSAAPAVTASCSPQGCWSVVRGKF